VRADRLDVRKGLLGLIDELRAEFTADPPCQPTLARTGRKYDREFGGNFEIFGDHLRAAVRYVGNRAVARQRAGPELYLRCPSAQTTFTSTSIYQHVDPSPCSITVLSAFQPPSKNKEELLEFAQQDIPQLIRSFRILFTDLPGQASKCRKRPRMPPQTRQSGHSSQFYPDADMLSYHQT